jgi:Carboxylesterase family
MRLVDVVRRSPSRSGLRDRRNTRGHGSHTIFTESGSLKSIVVIGVNKFLGIPYAAPPLGSLRRLPPRPPALSKMLSKANRFRFTVPPCIR